MTDRRHRERKQARRPSQWEPKPRILIVVEGKVTEAEYLDCFKAWCRNPRVEVEVDNSAGVPLTLVRRAKDRKAEAENRAGRERDQNLAYEEVWCLYDVDEHPDLPKTRDMARGNGIQFAESNPCFELWLVLHVRESPGPRSPEQMQRMARELGVVDGKHVRFEQISSGYESAVKRARRLDQDGEDAGEVGRNPSTGVWRLAHSIRGLP